MNTKLLFTMSCVLLVLFSLQAQQINMKGQVSIHNSQYNTGTIEYVENAQIIADFTKPSTTDIQGRFELEFVGLSKGTSVSIYVEKEGFELVNGWELQDVVLGRLSPIKIFLAPKGQIIKAQTEIYNISVETLRSQHQQIIKELKKNNANAQKVIEEMEQRLGRIITNRFEAEKILSEQLSKTKRRLPEFAKELATTNLDFSSEMFRKAYAYVKVGEIEKAIQTLDENFLDKNADDVVRNFEQNKTSLKSLDSTLLLEKKKYDTNIQALLLKAEGLEKQAIYQDAIETYYKILELEEESMFQNSKVKEKCFHNLWKLYEKTNQKIEERKFRKMHLNVVMNNSYVVELPEYLKGISVAYEQVVLDTSIIFQREALNILINRKAKHEKIQNARNRLIDLLLIYTSLFDLSKNIESISQRHQEIAQLFLDETDFENAVKYQRKNYEILKKNGGKHLSNAEKKLVVCLEKYSQYLERSSEYEEAIIIYEELHNFQPKNKKLKKYIKKLRKKIKANP